MPCRATQDRQVMVESSDKTWSTREGNGKWLQYPCLENPMKRMRMQKIYDLERWTPRLVSAQYATGDQWRNNFRKNEGMQPKQKPYPASRGDGIPVELFQILKDDAVKVLHSICQQIWKTQQWPQDWKRSVFIPIPKKGNAKECSNYCTIALISYTSKLMLKILQARLQQYVNCELPDVQAGFRKGREYTEELYKKDLHNQDHHNGMITQLEPDILVCEV